MNGLWKNQLGHMLQENQRVITAFPKFWGYDFPANTCAAEVQILRVGHNTKAFQAESSTLVAGSIKDRLHESFV